MNSISDSPEAVAFGRFRVLPHRRELLVDDQPTKLGDRAFDVLVALVEARGAVVSKDELMARVWPGRIVDENALQSQIVALRRVFGPDRDLIRTVSGRGYLFTGEIRTVLALSDGPATAEMPQSTLAASRPPTNLPEAVSRLIGREADLDKVLYLSTSHRLVTLTGAGGIGKTRLGFEVARHLLPRFADGIWAIELAPLSDPELVPVTVATALGLELSSGMASPLSVATALRAKQLMLVLDNCEHVVDAAAQMAEALLRANPAARVIATSREPLQAEGEWVYPVPPLAFPTEDSPEIEDSLRCGAVLLFIERARAAAPQFSFEESIAAAIVTICRRLDGIPLAIELAAARTPALGIEGLAAVLDDRFRLLAGGHRTALPRHQTLRATLDWSYELLTDPERAVLRRLAIFAGGFTLQAASAVVTDGEIVAPETVDCLASLVAKSLVTVDAGSARARYRLLETTRAYLLEKLAQAGEFDTVARRHSECYRDLFEGAEAEAATRLTDDWLADYAWEIDNLRAALDWTFSPDGDGSIAVALTAAAVPLWMQLSLPEECRSRAKQALGALGDGGAGNPREEMRLNFALGASLPDAPEMAAAFTRALDLAETLNDSEYRLRALRGLYFHSVRTNQFRAALSFAQEFYNLATSGSNQSDRLVGERMLGTSEYILGDLVGARRHLEQVLARNSATDLGRAAVRYDDVIRFQHDGQVEARVFLSEVLWLQGYPNQAIRMAEESLTEAQAIGHVTSQCLALALGSCTLALWTGNLSAAVDYTKLLVDLSARNDLSHWATYGVRYRRVIALKGGNVSSIEGIDQSDAHLRSLTAFTEFAEALVTAERSTEGLAGLDEFVAQSPELGIFTPEFLRIRGELLLLRTAPATAQPSEDLFRQSLDFAHRHEALSLELRAATSLARLLRDQGRQAEAIVCLEPIYERFTEGFDTVDLITAKRLLNELRGARRAEP